MSIQLKLHTDPQRWICMYPLYINSKRSIVQGRRVVQFKGIENPTSQEIFDVIEHAGFPCKLEVGLLFCLKFLKFFCFIQVFSFFKCYYFKF